MTKTRTALAAVALTASGLLLSGCANAQATIDKAQGLVDSAASIASAPEAVTAACTTALDGLAPGTPLVEARAALTTATQQLDDALGVAGSLPIVSDFRDALVSAADSLVGDGSAASLSAARQAVTTVCAVTQ